MIHAAFLRIYERKATKGQKGVPNSTAHRYNRGNTEIPGGFTDARPEQRRDPMSELSNIKNQALTERVEERLYRYILNERLPVGTKLPNEYQMANHFEVSRGTIREAVKLLASKGVVQVKHGSGTYVASTMPLQEDPLGLRFVEDKLQLALDLTDVRMMLEPNIAEMAALNRTDEEAALLVEYSADVRRRIEAGEEYMNEDMAFHSHIVKCSHNMVLKPLIPLIETAVLMIANITRQELLSATNETHDQIVNCILDRDSLGARSAMSMHLAMNRIVINREYKKSRKQ